MNSNMSKILDGLWLGNFDSANDSISHKRNGITHILTVAADLIPYNCHVRSPLY